LPASVRSITGCLFARGQDGLYGAAGDQLLIGGSRTSPGQLCLANGGSDVSMILTGRTDLIEKTWNHVALVRDGRHVTVYLNGNPTPEINGELEITNAPESEFMFFGGRGDRAFGFEGRLDDIAIYDRVLTPDELIARYRLTDLAPGK